MLAAEALLPAAVADPAAELAEDAAAAAEPAAATSDVTFWYRTSECCCVPPLEPGRPETNGRTWVTAAAEPPLT